MSTFRDFVGDTGDPHAGGISASPDVILRQTAVADPQASFGEGSGTENDPTLGVEAEAGQDNFIYVRVRNRGGSAATNVNTTVYWSPSSTLVTPDLWTLVGSTTIPSVLTGEQLTVSDAIVWPSGSIPATGHYCFVGLIGTAADPAPAPADFLNWNNFTEFIRSNNNVTWRNFNVVDNAPPPGAHPPFFVPLPFMAAGAPDQARRFRARDRFASPQTREAPVGAATRVRRVVAAQAGRTVARKNEKAPCIHLAQPVRRHAVQGGDLSSQSANTPAPACRNPERAPRTALSDLCARVVREREVGRVTWRLTRRGGDGP